MNSQFRSKLVKTISTSVTNLFSPFSFNFQPSLVSSNLFFMISPKIFILHYVPDLLIFISQSKTFTIFFQTFSHYFYFIFKPFCRIFPTFYFLFTILYFSFKFDQPFLCFFQPSITISLHSLNIQIFFNWYNISKKTSVQTTL